MCSDRSVCEGRMTVTDSEWYAKARRLRGETVSCPICGGPAEMTYICRPLVTLDCPAVDCPLCCLVPLHPQADLTQKVGK